MRWVVLAVLASACGRLGFDPRTVASDADPLTGDVAADTSGDAAAGSDAAMASGTVVMMQTTTAIASTGPQTVMLPAPTTAGTVLVATIGLNSQAALTVPSGWTNAANSMINGACASEILTEASGAAGRQSFMFTVAGGAQVTIQLSEWAGLATANPFDAAGFGGSTTSTLNLAIATLGATTTPYDTAIAAFCEDVNMPTFTAGTGWTELGQVPGSSATPSLLTEYAQNLPAGMITAPATSNLVAKYAATIITLRTQ